MFNLYKNTCQTPRGGAICKNELSKKFISFSLVLALMLSTLAFSTNVGPPTLADGENPTGYWDYVNGDGIHEYADFSWYTNHTGDGPYKINDADDLAGLAVLVNNAGITYGDGNLVKVTDENGNSIEGTDFAGKKIELTDDLDLSAHYWVPIGLGNEYDANWELVNVFKGSFDGGNYKIKNMKIGESTSYEDRYDHSGLFGRVSSSGLKEDEEVKIENITIGDGSYIYTSKNYAGGIIAYAETFAYEGEVKTGNITISNCHNNASIYVENQYDAYGGGILAKASTLASDLEAIITTGNITISECSNSGEITAKDKQKAYAGGILSYVSADALSENNQATAGTITLLNCNNNGNISAQPTSETEDKDTYAGGIIAYITASALGLSATAGNIEIINCHNTKKISATATTDKSSAYSGGLIAYILAKATNANAEFKAGNISIAESSNSGEIEANSKYSYANAGGLIAYSDAEAYTDSEQATANAGAIDISKSYNSGKVSAESSGKSAAAGGLMAYNKAYAKVKAINSTAITGGINISDSSNSGEISATAQGDASSNAAGFIAYVYASASANSEVSNSIATTGKVTLSNCINSKEITAIAESSFAEAGGFIAYACTITKSSAQGNSTSTVTAGTIEMINCYNTANINATHPEGSQNTDVKSFAAGLIAKTDAKAENSKATAGTITITNCYNIGTISAKAQKGYANAGGLIVSTSATATTKASAVGAKVKAGEITINNCYSSGSVFATAKANDDIKIGSVLAYSYAKTENKAKDKDGKSAGETTAGNIKIINTYYQNNCIKDTSGKAVADEEQKGFGTSEGATVTDNSTKLPQYQMQAAANASAKAEETWVSITVGATTKAMALVDALNAGAELLQETEPKAFYWGVVTPGTTYPEHNKIVYHNGKLIYGEVTTYKTADGATLSEDTPEKTGYTFAGWFDSENSPVTEIAQESLGAQNLYANWRAHTYTVKFNANNETAEGTMEDQNFTYDVGQELTANTFTRAGYTFKGWAAEEDKTKVVYTDKQKVKNLTPEDNGVVTLYAVWEVVQDDDSGDTGDQDDTGNNDDSGGTGDQDNIDSSDDSTTTTTTTTTPSQDSTTTTTPTQPDNEQNTTKPNDSKQEGFVEGDYAEGETPVWYYYKNGEKVSGWQDIEIEVKGQTEKIQRYYFDPESNIMQTGWLEYKNSWYYLDVQAENKEVYKSPYEGLGLMRKDSWDNDGGTAKYCFGSDGKMEDDWVQVKGKWYYLYENTEANEALGIVGQLATEMWDKGHDGYWYRVGPDGTELTAWQLIDNIWYYLGIDGKMVTGWNLIGNHWYYFYEDEPYDGDMAVNTVIDGYYIGADGKALNKLS